MEKMFHKGMLHIETAVTHTAADSWIRRLSVTVDQPLNHCVASSSPWCTFFQVVDFGSSVGTLSKYQHCLHFTGCTDLPLIVRSTAQTPAITSAGGQLGVLRTTDQNLDVEGFKSCKLYGV